VCLQRRVLLKCQIFKLYLIICLFAEKGEVRYLLSNKLQLHLTFMLSFVSCAGILIFFIMVMDLERWKWPGPLWNSQGSCLHSVHDKDCKTQTELQD
jgi:hypothetical protein